MKRKITWLVLALVSLNVTANPRLHLDMNTSGPTYRTLFAAMEKKPGWLSVHADDPLRKIVELGKRNLDWIETINQHRDLEHKLQLTTRETTQAYPIETPRVSNRSIIIRDLEGIKNTMPKEMADVLFGFDPLPEGNPIDDQTFIQYARLLNRIYEAASRWLLQEPELEEYKMLAALDVRGYYYLSNEPNVNQKLQDWTYLDEDTQQKFSQWLQSECRNAAISADHCQNTLYEAIQENQVLAYHEKYFASAREVYKGFFEIQHPRPEVLWNSKNPSEMVMPFTDPDRQDVREWFKGNVENEFHTSDWSLKINFQNTDNLAKVVFEPGVTPHVNALGGDTITMDSNPSLNEYEVTWTIRHEFGHILGFPDCYVEFYDEKAEAMISYQLDITNLMCSRRGHLQPKHIEQLQKYYYKA